MNFEILFPGWWYVTRLHVAVFRIVFYVFRGVLVFQATLLFGPKTPENTAVITHFFSRGRFLDFSNSENSVVDSK